MSNPSGSSSGHLPTHRGPRACTNCRKRKIKCDAGRPSCSQCRLRPPRSMEPCQYPLPEWLSMAGEESSSAQMLDTIATLRARVEELEDQAPDLTRVYLSQPYQSPDVPGRTTPMQVQMMEPPANVVSTLLDAFLPRFSTSGIFFPDPSQFRHAALLPLAFDHRQRPSSALLSAVYLWGSILSPHSVPPSVAVDNNSFLAAALRYLSTDLSRASPGLLGAHPQQHQYAYRLVLDSIQTSILLSFYYLHTASPLLGRYHAGAAASLALSIGLNSQSQNHVSSDVHRPLQIPRLSPPASANDAAVRIRAWWAVVILNNYWVAVEGFASPIPIPYGLDVDVPWPGSPSPQIAHVFDAQGGARSTITSFLNGNELNGNSPLALLAKASILLERIVAFNNSNASQPGTSTTSASLTTLSNRLHAFRAFLPPLAAPGAHGGQTLLLAHTLVDCAIIRLHYPTASLGLDANARGKCLAAAHRIVLGTGAPVYATAASFYLNQLRLSTNTRDIETKLATLMSTMASLAAYSPFIEQIFVQMRTAYAEIA
ncbi:hypothetical protein C8F01DRAFT_1084654 [Mycena amicta]|nr:hypothetical protein C8F01DRAFT_1084654 [Mycena amicta]